MNPITIHDLLTDATGPATRWLLGVKVPEPDRPTCHAEVRYRAECCCTPKERAGWYATIYSAQGPVTEDGPRPSYREALETLEGMLPRGAVRPSLGGGLFRFEVAVPC